MIEFLDSNKWRKISYNSDGRQAIGTYYGSGDRLAVFDRLLSEDIMKFAKHSVKQPAGVFPARRDNSGDVPFNYKFHEKGELG